LQKFPEPVFLDVPMESLHGGEEVYSRLTGITAEKAFNFLGDRWIAFKILQ